MTVSVGFRAPSIHEIINGVVSDALANTDEVARYCDPDLRAQAPGEIAPAAIDKLKRYITDHIASPERIESWLGRYVTESYCDVELSRSTRTPNVSALRRAITSGCSIIRTEGARCAYVRGAKRGEIRLYANGERMDLSGVAAALACEVADRVVVPADRAKQFIGDTSALTLLSSLIRRGLVVVE
jgi:50S ribosomal protein L16 3-hydroxylase